MGAWENLLYQAVPVTKVEELNSFRKIWPMSSFQREYVGRFTVIPSPLMVLYQDARMFIVLDSEERASLQTGSDLSCDLVVEKAP